MRAILRTVCAALAILLSPGLAAAQLDFSLSAAGPGSVAQGSSLYLVLSGHVVSGTAPTLIPIQVAGLPADTTVSFPDIARTCCGANQVYSFDFATTIKVSTAPSTPPGPAALTITVTAGSVTRTIAYPIIVTAPPAPIARQSYAPASVAPRLALWESNMRTYGQKVCAQLTDPALTSDQKLGAVYYDGERVFFNLRAYTSESSWDACAQSAESVYRDGYLMPNNGGVPGYWVFPHGLYLDHVRTGDPASQNALLLLSRRAAYGTDSPQSGMILPSASREVAYNLMAYLLARASGAPASSVGEAYVDIALGHIDQWFSSFTFRCPSDCDPGAAAGKYYIQPFMVALTAEALIQHYETQSARDPRIPHAVKAAMDWLWTHAWSAGAQQFWYDNYTDDPSTIPVGYWPSASPPAPDLNLLIAPAFAWLYKQTGDVTYRDRADAIFASGVEGACVACSGKHFNQQYRWSFDYLKWRNPGSLAAPANLTVR